MHRSTGAISQYVSGVTTPDLLVIAYFKKLIGDVEPIPGTDLELQESERSLSEWETTLLDELNAMDDEQRREFVKGVRILSRLVPKRDASYKAKPSAMSGSKGEE